jgi:drug/metabolite transporter (DMT)-like permease
LSLNVGGKERGLVSGERGGVLLCLLSAVAFSTGMVFGRVALEDGAGVLTILALRYAGAGLIFWGLVRLSGQPLPDRQPAARVVGLGAVVLAAQAALIYAALSRLDAGLVTLLLYTFPAMVAVASVAIGREQPSLRKAGAVVVATVGIGFVLLGDAQLSADGLGIVMALASAACAAGWVLSSDRMLRGMSALVVSALVSSGAAFTLWIAGLATGTLVLGFGLAGWAAIVGTILITTVVAISTSLAGMARVGPTVASVLLTVEVPLAVTWAIVLLGERLQPLQLVGGALVVAAVLLLQASSLRWPKSAASRYAPLVRTASLIRRLPPTP